MVRPRHALGLTITLEQRAVGNIDINILGCDRGRAHVHVVDSAARRGGVMSAVLKAGLPKILDMRHTESRAEGLVVEIRTRNIGMEPGTTASRP